MSDVTTSACQILVGQPWSLQTHGPTLLTCTAGAIWLTVDADPGDHVLRAGERMTIAPGRHVVAEALENAGATIICADVGTKCAHADLHCSCPERIVVQL